MDIKLEMNFAEIYNNLDDKYIFSLILTYQLYIKNY